MNHKVVITKDEIGLTHPFEYFLETLHALPYARIEVRTPDGLTGRGEIACSLDANGESRESAIALAGAIEHALAGMQITSEHDIEGVMERCELFIAFNRASKCGLEQALFDIVAQRRKTSVAALIGATYRPAKIQCAIPFLGTEEAYRTKIETILKARPEFVKFKIGKDLSLEAKAICMLRSIGPEVRVSADANQAFDTSESALRWLESTGDDLEWIEQPLHREDVRGWQTLKAASKTALMADESIHTSREALWYLEHSMADLINIKLAKAGGIIEARRIATLAREHSVPIMLGSMLHGPLGLRYNLAFGLSMPFLTYDFYSYFSLSEPGPEPLIDAETLAITETVMHS